MSKKPSWHIENKKKLIKLLEKEGYEYHFLNEYQVRVMGSTHIIDIWTPRMIYHIIAGETVKSDEPYYRTLDWQLNKEQVIDLLEREKNNMTPQEPKQTIEDILYALLGANPYAVDPNESVIVAKQAILQWINEKSRNSYKGVGDTPEDALAKLYCELFKKGVLKK